MLPTRKLTIDLLNVLGTKAANVNVTLTISSTEIYSGVLVPSIVRGTTNSHGILVLNVFPNTLGDVKTHYKISLEGFNIPRVHYTIVMPDKDVLLSGILVLDELENTELVRWSSIEARIKALEDANAGNWQEPRVKRIETTLEPLPSRITIVENKASTNSSNIVTINTRLDTLSTNNHIHSNKAELDKIKSGSVDNWNNLESNISSMLEGVDALFEGVVKGYDKTLPIDKLQEELLMLKGRFIIGNVNLTVTGGVLTSPLIVQDITSTGTFTVKGSTDANKYNPTHSLLYIWMNSINTNKMLIEGFACSTTDNTSFLVDTANGSVVFKRCVSTAGNRNTETNLGVVVKDGIVHTEDCAISNKHKAMYSYGGGEIILTDGNNAGTGNYYVFISERGGKIFTSKHTISGVFSTTTTDGGFIADGSIDGNTFPVPFSSIVIDIDSTVVESFNLSQSKLSTGRFKYTFTNQPKRATYGVHPSSNLNTYVPRSDKLQSSFVIEYSNKSTGALEDPQTASIFINHNA